MRFLHSWSICLLLLAAPCFAQSQPATKTMSPEEIKAFVEKAEAERKDITVKVRKRVSGQHERIEIYRGKASRISKDHFHLDDEIWLYGSSEEIAWQDVISVGKRNPVQKTIQYTARAAGSAAIAPIIYPLSWIFIRGPQ